MHRNHDEDDPLTPDERLYEIARILAGGILRLRARVALHAAPAQLPGPQILESGPNSLAGAGDARLSVHPG